MGVLVGQEERLIIGFGTTELGISEGMDTTGSEELTLAETAGGEVMSTEGEGS